MNTYDNINFTEGMGKTTNTIGQGVTQFAAHTMDMLLAPASQYDMTFSVLILLFVLMACGIAVVLIINKLTEMRELKGLEKAEAEYRLIHGGSNI